MKRWIFSFTILLLSAFMLVGCNTGKTKASRVDPNSDTLLEDLKELAHDYLKSDKEISEFTIDSIRYSYHNGIDDYAVYLVEYSMKPSDPETFVIAGGGREGEDGWIVQRSLNCAVTEDGKVTIGHGGG